MLDCNFIELMQLSSVSSPKTVTELHDAINNIIRKFQSIFEALTELPPRRASDHKIPLIPGATPTHSGPYRHTPAMKDEIEEQIKEMFHVGVIQQNTSAFSSPVLLVKNKDETWRFCIDYRGLNALIVKGKFLILVID
jgi:hypothetical protein